MSRTNFIRKQFKKTLTDGLHSFGPPFCVPSNIVRPHPKRDTQFGQCIPPELVPIISISAKIAASALSLAKELALPGVTTELIDTEVSRYIVSRGAYPSGIGFMGFPKSICTSVNEVIAHGIPDTRPLQNGDIVNFDVTCYRQGFYGDNSDMALVGDVDGEGHRLVETTREALLAAIEVCRPGQDFSAISQAIARVAGDYNVVPYFCGHFIGTEMHISPNIQHCTTESSKMSGLKMCEGMLFTIEPILVEGSTEAVVWKDGWTYVTKDGGRTAQAEHMVFITKTGCEILTIPDEVFQS